MAGLNESGLSGLTKKQSEMNRSFSPANNNQQNEAVDLSTPAKNEGLVQGSEYADARKEATGRNDLSAAPKTARAGPGSQEVAGLQKNLGVFNSKLIATMNDFLSGQTASNLNTSLASGGTPTFNQATGLWESADAKTAFNVNSLQEEKLQQQQNLKDVSAELFTNGKAKSFEDVLMRFADKNNDGVIDEVERTWANEATAIANSLRRLKTSDPYSAEAEALTMQLNAKDKNGLVSGIMDALDKYDAMVEMKTTGADANAYYLRDLLTMNQDKIQQELEKAVTQSSGLFGADYQANIKRSADESAQQYTEAGREDATVMGQLKSTAQNWLKGYEAQFGEGRTQLNKMFQGASDTLVKDLDDAVKADPTNKGIQQAKDWFVDTQTLVKGGKDFGSIVFKALTSSTLGAEAKTVLKKWLGQTIGDDATEKGVIASLLDQISTTGYMYTQNSAGQQVKVAFTPAQKMDVVRLMNDSSKTSTEKNKALEGIISGASQGMAGDLTRDLGKVLDPIKNGSLEVGLNNWERAMTGSMKDFDKSLVQAGYAAAVQKSGRQSDPALVQQAIQQQAQGKLDEINKAYEATNKLIQDKKAQVAADVTAMIGNQKLVDDLNAKGVASVQQSWSDALGMYSKEAMTQSPQKLPDGSTMPLSRLQIAYLNALQAKGGTLGTKSTVSGVTSMDVIPADINSVKYAQPYSTLAMFKNLKGIEAPAYTTIVRDYLGGVDQTRLAAAMSQPGLIFMDNSYLAIADKIVQALRDPKIAAQVWGESPAYKALQSKMDGNKAQVGIANSKLAEITAAEATLKQSMADANKQLNKGVANASRLSANISGETANNMFNQAVGGRQMQFTDMPTVDLKGMQNAGNIQYVNHEAGLNPTGLEQYTRKEWSPSGAETMTQAKYRDVTPAAMGTATTITNPTIQIRSRTAEGKQGDRSIDRTQIAKITPTGNPGNVTVTMKDGTVINNVGIANGTFTGDIGVTNPDINPGGTFAGQPGTLQSKQTPAPATSSTTWERVVNALTPDWLKPTPSELAKNAAENYGNQQKAASMEQGKIDAQFDQPPERPYDAEYMKGYNEVNNASNAAEAAKNAGANTPTATDVTLTDTDVTPTATDVTPTEKLRQLLQSVKDTKDKSGGGEGKSSGGSNASERYAGKQRD